MLLNPLIEQLRGIKLLGMSEALSEQLQDSAMKALSFEERLAFLVDREVVTRNNRLLQSRLKQAKLHCSQACIEDISYDEKRKIDKKLIATLSTSDWLREHSNLILTGATGTGKSWLACAIAHKACLLGFKAQYWRVSRLLEELALSCADGRYLRILKSLKKVDLLILDDWGMEHLQGKQQHHILQILDDRYLKKSFIITSQLPLNHWHERIEDKTHADAILDRMTGRSYRMELKGDSMRQQLMTEKEVV